MQSDDELISDIHEKLKLLSQLGDRDGLNYLSGALTQRLSNAGVTLTALTAQQRNIARMAGSDPKAMALREAKTNADQRLIDSLPEGRVQVLRAMYGTNVSTMADGYRRSEALAARREQKKRDDEAMRASIWASRRGGR